jgi:hypothetical protein
MNSETIFILLQLTGYMALYKRRFVYITRAFRRGLYCMRPSILYKLYYYRDDYPMKNDFTNFQYCKQPICNQNKHIYLIHQQTMNNKHFPALAIDFN